MSRSGVDCAPRSAIASPDSRMSVAAPQRVDAGKRMRMGDIERAIPRYEALMGERVKRDLLFLSAA